MSGFVSRLTRPLKLQNKKNELTEYIVSINSINKIIRLIFLKT